MLHQTALHATHEALGATLVDFGGWDMPLWYPTGAVKEHSPSSSTPDCSISGIWLGSWFPAPDALEALQWAFTRICPCPVRVPLTARSSMRPAAWWMTPSYTP